jgi:hypothetical protein
MNTKNPRSIPDIESDPFGESRKPLAFKTMQLLGGRFEFESDNPELLRLVNSAYAGLPAHRFSSRPMDFRVTLIVTPTAASRARRHEPQSTSMLRGGHLLGSASESSTFVVLSPMHRTALISVSREMLRFPYHTRYELIEFAVFTLAARAQKLVPMHAACVGLNGRGILLIGPTGAGKSTAALHTLLNGFDFVAEDSVFVEPNTMRATGIANFLHVRKDSLSALNKSPERTLIRNSPVIRRRSGIEKFEVDLRRGGFRLAPAPLTIAAVAVLSEKTAGAGPVLRAMPRGELLATMNILQAYGAGLPQWQVFRKNLRRVDAFEVRRGRHPLETVDALRSILAHGEETSPITNVKVCKKWKSVRRSA